MRRRFKRALLAGALGLVLLFGGCMVFTLGGAPADPDGAGGQPGTAPGTTATPTATSNATGSATPSETPAPDSADSPDRPDGVPSDTQEVTVRRVVDGDTLEVAALASGAALASTSQVDVRLLEIDTPETKDPSEPVQCYGQRATTALERMLPTGSRAWVQRDQELRDTYGRYLLYVWNDDGRFVNLTMVRRGYARAVLYEPNDRHWSEISAAERDVRRTDRGLWGACARFGAPADPPADPQAEPAPEQPPAGGGYPVPPPPPDRDCSGVPETNFEVRPGDPHRFDRDGDGIGCES